MSPLRRTLTIVLASLLALGPLAGQGVAAASVTTDPAAIRVAPDVTFATAEGRAQQLDVYWPEVRVDQRAAVVLVHGGAWNGRDKENMEWMARRLAAHGYVAVAINYRLRSSTPWPSELTDVQAAIRFIRSRATTMGIDPDRIAILGDSAGGNLAALAGAAGSGSWSADARVKAVVSFSGIYDVNGLIEQVAGDARRGWLADAVASFTGCPIASVSDACVGARSAASPITSLDPSDPPHLLFDSTAELIPMIQATTMQRQLRAAGVPVERTTYTGADHGRVLFDDGLALTLDFLQRNL